MDNKVIAVGGLIGIVVLLVLTGVIPVHVPNLNVGTPTPQPPIPGATQTAAVGSDDFDVDPLIVDHFVSSTTYTVGAANSIGLTYYGKSGSNYQYLGTGDMTITVDELVYGNTLWVLCDSADDYYVDWEKTVNDQPRFMGVIYSDVDNDDTDEFVFEMNIAGVQNPEYLPKLPITIFTIRFEAPSMADLGTTTTSCGTSTVVKQALWYTEQTTTNRGWALSRIELVWKTDTAGYTAADMFGKITYIKIQVPGIGLVDMTSKYQLRSSDVLYTYILGDKLETAHYILTSSTDINRQDFYTDIKLTFNSGDPDYDLTLYLYYIDPGATSGYSVASVNDLWYCSDT